jgi:hypothetical protein
MSTLLTLLTEEGAGHLCEEEAEVAGRAQEAEATASTITTSATTPLVAQVAPVGRRIPVRSMANWVTVL